MLCRSLDSPVVVTGWSWVAMEILHHLETFWTRRGEPNVQLFHYSDLLADLPGQLRHLSDSLGIPVTDDRLAEFAEAGTFRQMKQRADVLVPDGGNRIWLSNSDFFHRARNGQGRDVLDADELNRYDQRVGELAAPDLADWAHHGWLGRS